MKERNYPVRKAADPPQGGFFVIMRDQETSEVSGRLAMFIRFVTHQIDDDSGRRQGLFQALDRLQADGALSSDEEATWNNIYQWFRHNLKRPSSFTRSSKPHAKRVALSWFKDSAREHIANMYVLMQVLASHGTVVEVIRTESPGYVVYEDEYQIVAEPFSDTIT